MIQTIKNKIHSGLKLYHGHNEDNSTNNRKSVGRIVTSLTKEVGGKLQTIAIACMDSIENIFDVCSIEAEVYEENGNVNEVEKISGIAVANSQVEQPAFSNARRLIPVQFFNSGEELQKTGEEKNMDITLKDLMSIPKDLLKQAIKERQLKPAQIYEFSDIEEDREFSTLITDKKAALEKAEALEKENSLLKEESTNSKKELIKSTAKSELEKLLSKDLTTRQKDFILNRFNPEKVESLDEDILKGHIEGELNEYKDYAKMFTDTKENDNKLDPIENNDMDDETTAFEKAFDNDE